MSLSPEARRGVGKEKNNQRRSYFIIIKPTLMSPAGELVLPQARGCKGRNRRIQFLFSFTKKLYLS